MEFSRHGWPMWKGDWDLAWIGNYIITSSWATRCIFCRTAIEAMSQGSNYIPQKAMGIILLIQVLIIISVCCQKDTFTNRATRIELMRSVTRKMFPFEDVIMNEDMALSVWVFTHMIFHRYGSMWRGRLSIAIYVRHLPCMAHHCIEY